MTRENNNKKYNKRIIIKAINTFFIFSVITFLLLSLIRTFIKPKDIFEGENRYAEKYSGFSLKSFYNKKFQNKIENVLSDQLLLSGEFRTYNNFLKAITINKYINIFLNDDDLKYLNSDGIAFFGKKNLIYYCRNLEDLKDELNIKISNYNDLITKYNNIDLYFYYIEKDTDINFLNNDIACIYEYIKDNINTQNIDKFKIDNFDQFKNYFYETDHHWNYKGSYQGYKDVINLLNVQEDPLVGKEKCLDLYWSGSKAGISIYNKIMKENFCAYKYDFPNMNILINGKESDYGHQEEYLNGSKTSNISYGSFYGDDDGEIIFYTENNQKDNLLIIGESYDNAILKLIASHFNKTISIDLRNYEHYMGKEFDFDNYIKKYNINKVLFIGNVDFYSMEQFMIKEGN